MKTTWTAGYNVPGYLPESDPASFETFDDAKRWILEEMERAQDLVDELDAIEISHATQDINLESKPFCYGPFGDGYVYWVEGLTA